MKLSMATNWNKLVFLFRIELSCKTNILYLILGKSLRQWIPMTQSNTKLTSFNFLSKNMRYLYHIPNFWQSTIQLDHHKKSLIINRSLSCEVVDTDCRFLWQNVMSWSWYSSLPIVMVQLIYIGWKTPMPCFICRRGGLVD